MGDAVTGIYALQPKFRTFLWMSRSWHAVPQQGIIPPVFCSVLLTDLGPKALILDVNFLISTWGIVVCKSGGLHRVDNQVDYSSFNAQSIQSFTTSTWCSMRVFGSH